MLSISMFSCDTDSVEQPEEQSIEQLQIQARVSEMMTTRDFKSVEGFEIKINEIFLVGAQLRGGVPSGDYILCTADDIPTYASWDGNNMSYYQTVWIGGANGGFVSQPITASAAFSACG